jgi:RNA polymerase sigma factor (sigma-70 family)
MVSRVRERAGLETLCLRYWKPVYAWCRLSWCRANEEAKDFTQEFFSWLLEEEVLSKYSPDLGSFRGFLKGLLRNFSGNRLQALRAEKRGGAAFRVPLDAVPEPRGSDPESEFDRAWLGEVIRLATDRARTEYAGAVAWKAFEAYDIEGGPSYAEVAQSLGIKEGDVRNHLHAVRTRMREIIREELRETVAGDSELEEEWRALFGK